MPSMMPAASLQDKGTQTVSTCSCKHMGSASGRGSAHLRTRNSSGRRAEKTPAKGERAKSAQVPSPLISAERTMKMKIDQPSRARFSHDLRKRTRWSQHAMVVMTVCGS